MDPLSRSTAVDDVSRAVCLAMRFSCESYLHDEILLHPMHAARFEMEWLSAHLARALLTGTKTSEVLRCSWTSCSIKLDDDLSYTQRFRSTLHDVVIIVLCLKELGDELELIVLEVFDAMELVRIETELWCGHTQSEVFKACERCGTRRMYCRIAHLEIEKDADDAG